MASKLDVVRCVMLPNQKRVLIAAIVEAGLAPGDFEWTDVISEYRGEKETALMIKHRHKDYYFTVDRAVNDTWWIEFCPAGQTEWVKRTNAYWGHVVDCAKTWAKRVAIELEDEDYVQLATGSPQLLTLPSPDGEVRALTPNERELIIQRLDEIETFVLELRLGSDEFKSQVGTSFQFLKHHAKQSDRRSFHFMRSPSARCSLLD